MTTILTAETSRTRQDVQPWIVSCANPEEERLSNGMIFYLAAIPEISSKERGRTIFIRK